MPTILDGAMGTQLLVRVPSLKSTEIAVLTNPSTVTDTHRAYIDAGSRIILANTFAANRVNADKHGYDLHSVIGAALSCANSAVQDSGQSVQVALDIGALGEHLDPVGDLTPEFALDTFREIVKCAEKSNVAYDIVYIETMSDLEECELAVIAAKESGKPVFVTMSFDSTGHTMYGVTPTQFIEKIAPLGVDAIGFNCFVTPEQGRAIFDEFKAHTNLPIIVKPNNTVGGDASDFAAAMRYFIDNGASYIGGCCGTTPECIARLRREYRI